MCIFTPLDFLHFKQNVSYIFLIQETPLFEKCKKDAKEQNKFDSKSTSDRHLKRQHFAL